MTEIPDRSAPPDSDVSSGGGLFSGRQVAVPVAVATLITIALYVTFDRFFPVDESDGRFLDNSVSQLISFLFLGTMIYGLLQFLGLRIDAFHLKESHTREDSRSAGYTLLCFLSGRRAANDDGLLSAGRRWCQDLPQAEDFAILADQLLAARERQYQHNIGPLQFGIWVLPMLGFIGTVIGITRAIGGLQEVLGQFGASGAGLEAVLGGLQFAFDTTLFGLVLVIPVMLATLPLRARGQAVAMLFHEALLDSYFRRHRR